MSICGQTDTSCSRLAAQACRSHVARLPTGNGHQVATTGCLAWRTLCVAYSSSASHVRRLARPCTRECVSRARHRLLAKGRHPITRRLLAELALLSVVALGALVVVKVLALLVVSLKIHHVISSITLFVEPF